MPTLIASLLAADSVHDTGTVLLAILGLGFLIMVHELGHFLACRLTGTRVETFSIGFGPRLFGWERSPDGKRSFTVGERRLDASTGAMDVRIAAIPLGGYVKMAGEIGGDGSPTSGADGEPRVPLPDEFPAKSFGARVFIISAGVLMNFLTAFVLYWISYGVGVSDTPPVIGEVGKGGPAWQAGLRPGDRVLTIDGRTMRTFTDVRAEIVYGSSDEDTQFVVRRGDRTETLGVRPEYDEAKGLRQAHLGQIATWTVNDGKSPAFTVGATERVLVEGRPVVGGYGAYTAVKEAIDLGYKSVRLELPDRPSEPPRTLDLSMAHTWSPSGPFRIGVVSALWRTVASVRPGGAAQRAGLLAGDEILAADGKALDDPTRLAFLPALAALTVRRPTGPGASEERQIEVGAADSQGVVAFLDDVALRGAARGAAPILMPQGRDFEDGKSPAGAAGVLPGDRLLSVGEREIKTWDDIVEAAGTLTAAPVKLRVQTGTEPPRDLMVMPRPIRDPRGPSVLGEPEAPRERIPVDGALDAARIAVARTASEVENIFRLIGRFFGIGGRVSFQKNVGGPFTIGAISSATVSLGLTFYLAFLAFISVNLAVLNILPIPVLDGGHLLFLVIEKLRGGRPLKEATIARFQMVGFLMLLALMAFALLNDFKHLFGS
ncbi:MAG TPA: site-2 protease family protein [Planctomycetota bacterium]|nr:site-2 protease family protein [Planctomycetota bacterium]